MPGPLRRRDGCVSLGRMIASRTKRAFIAGLTFGLVGSFASVAGATWWRTVGYGQQMTAGTPVTLSFPSDTVSSETAMLSGNTTTEIYVDYVWTHNDPRGSFTTHLQACGSSYDGSGGGCGTASINNYTTASGNADVGIPKWTGTGNEWDYFWVNAYYYTSGLTQPTVTLLGFGAYGS
jgi:hypothetical protein